MFTDLYCYNQNRFKTTWLWSSVKMKIKFELILFL